MFLLRKVDVSDYKNTVGLSYLDFKEAFIQYSSQRKLLFKVEMVQINKGIISSWVRKIRSRGKRRLRQAVTRGGLPGCRRLIRSIHKGWVL